MLILLGIGKSDIVPSWLGTICLDPLSTPDFLTFPLDLSPLRAPALSSPLLLCHRDTSAVMSGDQRIFDQLDQLERGARETRRANDSEYGTYQSHGNHDGYDFNDQTMQSGPFGRCHVLHKDKQYNTDMFRRAPRATARLSVSTWASCIGTCQTVSAKRHA